VRIRMKKVERVRERETNICAGGKERERGEGRAGERASILGLLFTWY
jgi:hypothetical protein